MFRKEDKQRSVTDGFINLEQFANKTLTKIDKTINWNPIQDKISETYSMSGPGKPGYPALVLFKAVLLQQWYGLSDPGLEEAITVNLSFRLFCGLRLEDRVPDHSTIHRFRDRIAPIIKELMESVDRQLAEHSCYVRQGTLVDATLVESVGRPVKVKGQKPSDPDAAWGVKKNKKIYGYKGHIGLDEGSELIRQAEFTPANIHDSQQFREMVSGDEYAVYADKAYASRAHSDWLLRQGIEDCILFKGSKDRPLTDIQKALNREMTAIRRNVEHVFGTFKRLYHWGRVRYFNLSRNRCSFLLLCIAYNLKRMVKLKTA